MVLSYHEADAYCEAGPVASKLKGIAQGLAGPHDLASNCRNYGCKVDELTRSAAGS